MNSVTTREDPAGTEIPTPQRQSDRRTGRRVPLLLVLFATMLAAAIVIAGGSLLVVDHPEKSDVIIVLAGENQYRPQRGVELLRAGYAPRMLLDVVPQEIVFGTSDAELGRRWIQRLSPDIRDRSTVLLVNATSTKQEAIADAPVLHSLGCRSALLVTSDYHTRRALTIFRHEVSGVHFSVAATSGGDEYGRPWWGRREWAKTVFIEGAKFLWFECVDRWIR